MTLTEAKHLADKLSAGRRTVYTQADMQADMQEAKRLLEATNRQQDSEGVGSVEAPHRRARRGNDL